MTLMNIMDVATAQKSILQRTAWDGMGNTGGHARPQ